MKPWGRRRAPDPPPNSFQVAVNRLDSLARDQPHVADALFRLIEAITTKNAVSWLERNRDTDDPLLERIASESRDQSRRDGEAADAALLEYMGASELAAAMKVPRAEVVRRVNAGEIPFDRHIRRKVFHRERTAAWAGSNGETFEPDPDIVTVHAAAKILGVDRAVVHELFGECSIENAGDYPLLVFSRRHLEHWIAEGRRRPSKEDVRARCEAAVRRAREAVQGVGARQDATKRTLAKPAERARWKFQREEAKKR